MAILQHAVGGEQGEHGEHGMVERMR